MDISRYLERRLSANRCFVLRTWLQSSPSSPRVPLQYCNTTTSSSPSTTATTRFYSSLCINISAHADFISNTKATGRLSLLRVSTPAHFSSSRNTFNSSIGSNSSNGNSKSNISNNSNTNSGDRNIKNDISSKVLGSDGLLGQYERDLDGLVRSEVGPNSKKTLKVSTIVSEIGRLPAENFSNPNTLSKIMSVAIDYLSKNKIGNERELASYSSLLRPLSLQRVENNNLLAHRNKLLQLLSAQIDSFKSESLSVFTLSNICFHLCDQKLSISDGRAIFGSLSRKTYTDTDKMSVNNLLSMFSSLRNKDGSLIHNCTEMQRFISVLNDILSRFPETLVDPDLIGDVFYNLRDISTAAVNENGRKSEKSEVDKLISVLSRKIKSCEDDSFSMANISHILYGIRKMKSDNNDIVNLLDNLSLKIESLAEEPFGSHQIAMSIYGLQGMSSDTPVVRKIVKLLTSKLLADRLISTKFNAQEIGMAFYGLHSMSSDHVEVRRLLAALTTKLSKNDPIMKSQEIGNMLFGLKGCRSSCKEVVALLPVIESKLKNCRPGRLRPHYAAVAIYGMQLMDSSDRCVDNLLGAITNYVSHCEDSFSASDIAMFLFGLKSMSGESRHVIKLVSFISSKLNSCEEEFTSQQIAMCLYGLQGISSKHKEVRGLLQKLDSKLSFLAHNKSSHIVPLTSQTIGNSLYGLKNMSSDYFEVRSSVALLSKMLQTGSKHNNIGLNDQEIANSLYGLRNMQSCYPEVLSLIKELTLLIKNSSSPSSLPPFAPSIDDSYAAQAISNSAYGLQGFSSDSEVVRDLVASLTTKFQGYFPSNTSEENVFSSDISPHFVSTTLYGMQCLNNDNKEVCDFIDGVASKVLLFKGSLPFKEIAMALYGLQNMSKSQPTLTDIVRFLSKQLSETIKEASLRDKPNDMNVSNTLVGISQVFFSLIQLSKFSNPSEISSILSSTAFLLREQIQYIDNSMINKAAEGVASSIVKKTSSSSSSNSSNSSNSNSSSSSSSSSISSNSSVEITDPLCASLQSLHLLKFFGKLSSENVTDISSLIADISSLDSSLFLKPTDRSSISKFESYNVGKAVVAEFNLDRYDVHYNVILLGFHQDIVIRNKHRTDGKLVAVEVDGPSHRQFKKQRYNKLHDEFLYSAHGIVTHRIDYRSDNQLQLKVIFAKIKNELNK